MRFPRERCGFSSVSGKRFLICFWIKAPMHHEVRLKTSDFEKLLQPHVISRDLTWVQDTLPRTSLRWSDGVGSRCLMKLVHSSSILIQFWSLSGFWKRQLSPFWIEFVFLRPPGVEETKLWVEPIHVPHVEEVIGVADAKVPEHWIFFLSTIQQRWFSK